MTEKTILKEKFRIYFINSNQRYDLTAMFGRKNANAIYKIERSFPGRGVAVFESLFPQPYHIYKE